MMTKITIILEKNGKITLPKEYLKALNLKEGEKMKIELLHKERDWPYLFIEPIKQVTIDKL
jgi:bifunctional DNA-binding transcriptional regulator/antitoxin component of YhaV-PrlF toxin-antitoxin module